MLHNPLKGFYFHKWEHLWNSSIQRYFWCPQWEFPPARGAQTATDGPWVGSGNVRSGRSGRLGLFSLAELCITRPQSCPREQGCSSFTFFSLSKKLTSGLPLCDVFLKGRRAAVPVLKWTKFLTSFVRPLTCATIYLPRGSCSD